MPRETIINAESIERPAVEGTEDYPPSEARTETKLGLSVGWNRAGWVQLYMLPPDADTASGGHVIDLDRSAINRAIRTLRKARDAAYGRDE